jgi:hypothetical protein
MKTKNKIDLLRQAIELQNSILEWKGLLKTANAAIKNKSAMFYRFELREHIATRETAKAVIKNNEIKYKQIINELYEKN